MRLASFIAVLVVGASSAHAAGRLAIVNLKMTDLGDAERAEARATIEHAVQQAGLELVPNTQVQYVEGSAPDLFACFIEDRCRAEIGQRLTADYLLTGTISKEDGATVARLDVFDVLLATVAKRDQVACPRCGVAAFDHRLAAMLDGLLRAAREIPRGTLAVRTNPPGAEVKVDGRVVGASNIELVVAAGTHTIELGGPGRSPISMPVDVKTGERREVTLTMSAAQEIPSPPVGTLPPTNPPSLHPPPSKPEVVTWWQPQRKAGVALAAGGLALVVASIPLFAIDGGCSADGACLFQHDTKGAAIGLVVSGAVVALTGAILMLVTHKHVQAALAPSFMAAGSSAGARF